MENGRNTLLGFGFQYTKQPGNLETLRNIVKTTDPSKIDLLTIMKTLATGTVPVVETKVMRDVACRDGYKWPIVCNFTLSAQGGLHVLVALAQDDAAIYTSSGDEAWQEPVNNLVVGMINGLKRATNLVGA